MARTSLPPGFRFHPTDVELIMYYLKRKVMGKKLHFEAIAEVNIYKFSPWDLPDKSCLKSKDLEWFFFCPREKKYASGIRVKRATENGYWKTTGKDRLISHKDQTVGSLKTLVFHLGHAPKGERTDWVIHEYKILDDQLAAAGVQDTYVLCKLFKKNGLGPKNGAQYGAPFNEADWADDDDTQNLPISFASDGLSASTQMQPETQSCALATGTLNPRSTSALPENEEGPSPSAGQPTSEVLVHQTEDEIDRLLASFTEENTKLLISENGISQDDLSGKGKNKDVACSDGYDIYNGLGDLGSWGEMDEGRLDLSTMQKDCYSIDKILPQDNSAYIELDDLLVPLDCSDEDTGTDKSLVGDIVGSYIHDYRQNFCAGSSFAAMNHYSSCANQLSLMPEGFYDGDHSVNVLQMADNQLYEGNVEYGMDVLLGQPDNGLNSNQDMERGRSAADNW